MQNEYRKAKIGNRPQNNYQTQLHSLASVTLPYMETYYTVLLSDAAQILVGHYSKADYTRDLARLIRRVRSEGICFATKIFPQMGQALLSLASGQRANLLGFKKYKPNTEYPVFLNRLFALALENSDSVIRGKAFDLLYSLTTAFKKLKGPYDTSVLAKQFADFINTDKELASLDFKEESVASILESARAIIYGIVRDVSLEDIRLLLPRPGPGATNTKMEKTRRYRPRVLYDQINDVLPYQEWWYIHPWDACLRSPEMVRAMDCSKPYPTARFKFVDKTYEKPRGICIEENEMQVMQQAFRVALYSVIQKKLYPRIVFDDQSINAWLAFLASIDSEDATIDMSEGSDRIARKLVAYGFQDNEPLCEALLALSTKWIKTPSELLSMDFPPLVPTEKYAPMGSALCFPVMSLMHYALCAAIIEHNSYPGYTTHELVERLHVYGDDIVVPSVCTEDIFHWLPKFGMKLNKNKSFYAGHFRESCGIHAYHGRDVTPVYVKYKPSHCTPDAMASVIANESQAVKKGWLNLARFLRDQLRTEYSNQLDYVPEGLSLAGFSRTFSESDLRRFKQRNRLRWSKNYQCWIYRATRLNKHIVEKQIDDDYSAYIRWLWVHAPNEGPLGDPFDLARIGDSSGDLSLFPTSVLESALCEARVQRDLELYSRRCPTGRVIKDRSSVNVQKVVLRQSGNLQQMGASSFCCFI